MESINESHVVELVRDRCARTANFKVARKSVLTPDTMIRSRTDTDTNAFLYVKTNFQCPQVNQFSTRICDANTTLLPYLREVSPEHRLAPSATGLATKAVFENTIIWADPAGEYTLYEDDKVWERMMRSLEVPPFVREYFGQLRLVKKITGASNPKGWESAKEKMCVSWWQDLIADTRRWEEVINETSKAESDCLADIGFTFVPPYFSKETLDITKKMNRRSSWLSSNRKQFATVMIPTPQVFRDDDLLDDMIEYIEGTTKGPVVIKPKGLDISRPRMAESRNRVRYFLNKMDIFRQKYPDRLVVGMELGENAFPFAAMGFDCVGTSATGYEQEHGGRKGQKKFVGFTSYHMDTQMINIPYTRLYSDTFPKWRKLPCDCPVCEPVTTLNGMKRDYWNGMIARPHYMMIWNKRMNLLSRLINTNQIQKARDILAMSELCTLKSLLFEV